MANQDWKIAVVGGGIGGLTLALALREHGIEVDIYEQADELREVGAAVALSANANRFYERIGLRPQFDEVAYDIQTLIYRDGRSGEVIGRHEGRPSYRAQYGASYWGIHRADLQPLDNLELFGMSPLYTLESYRAMGRNAAGYALGRRVGPVPTELDNFARAKLIVRTTLLHAQEARAAVPGTAPVELALVGRAEAELQPTTVPNSAPTP